MKMLSVYRKFDIWRLFVAGDFCGLGLQSALESRNRNMSLVWQPLLQRPTPSPDVSEKASELSTQKGTPGPHSVSSDSCFRHSGNKHACLVFKTIAD